MFWLNEKKDIPSCREISHKGHWQICKSYWSIEAWRSRVWNDEKHSCHAIWTLRNALFFRRLYLSREAWRSVEGILSDLTPEATSINFSLTGSISLNTNHVNRLIFDDHSPVRCSCVFDSLLWNGNLGLIQILMYSSNEHHRFCEREETNNGFRKITVSTTCN